VAEHMTSTSGATTGFGQSKCPF